LLARTIRSVALPSVLGQLIWATRPHDTRTVPFTDLLLAITSPSTDAARAANSLVKGLLQCLDFSSADRDAVLEKGGALHGGRYLVAAVVP